MKMQRGQQSPTNLGFTIVELLITLAVLTLLLLMGIMSLQGAEKPARDEERKTDAKNIALALERFYKAGNPECGFDSGKYPSTTDLSTAINDNYITEGFLPDANKAMFYYSFNNDRLTLKPATNTKVDDPSITILNAFKATGDPAGYIIYEPMALNTSNNWVLCNSPSLECRRFNLYYFLENSAADASAVQTIRSVNQ